MPHHVPAGTSLRHTRSISVRNSQTGLRLRGHPASLPAANSPSFARPVSYPDRSSIAISVSRFRYCRSWVICLMPSGPSWSRQSVYATWLETSSRAWTASCLNPIIISLVVSAALPSSSNNPFPYICHDTQVPRLVVLGFHQVAAPAVGLSVQCSSAAATL